MSEIARLVTTEELEKFPDDDYRYELVGGRVIRMSPVGFQHGRVVARLCVLLGQHVQGRNLGVIATELGFELARHPDTVRAPDVAFIRQDRIPSKEPRGFWKGPPDLAIEVVSPDDRPSDVRTKVEEYLTRGVSLVVVVDPDERAVRVFCPSSPPITLAADALLDLGDVVPDFRCSVREIFD